MITLQAGGVQRHGAYTDEDGAESGGHEQGVQSSSRHPPFLTLCVNVTASRQPLPQH